MNLESQPVLIGVAQHTWRDKDVARTPVDALQAVATQALSDTGSARVTATVDRIVHVPFIMTQVAELAAAIPVNVGAVLAERLGIKAPVYSAQTGGDLPQALINEFAGQLYRGECRCVLLCGVELLATFLGHLRSAGVFPDWSTGRSDPPREIGAEMGAHCPTEVAHGLFEPINTYPLFESALAHAKGLDADAHQQRLGALVASMSEVAARNPLAWIQQTYSSEEVLSTENGNRMISHPYTKLMNSIIGVDQAAALVLTTVGEAQRLGVDPQRWIYLRGSGAAVDTNAILQRESLSSSRYLQTSARSALDQAKLTIGDMNFFDLYSCFPSAVQVACDALGLAIDDPRGLTVTGGMTLFGGPGNNYSMHAIAEMVGRLREHGDGAGLVTANGGYLTKHAAGVYATQPGDRLWEPRKPGDAPGDSASLKRPAVAHEAEGELTLEAHTVHYSRGEPSRGIVVGRLADGRRSVAISDDVSTIARLISGDCVGEVGPVAPADGLNRFRF